ncbi:uncharacterized protein LOC105443636 [Strongylocentrotus purpuratus]|uniref:Uncharacterized protein n=1 Tax=Strongylocentrotus purpuratus TaxID=7668 RepID=A0A7M7HKD4_STRPU|nr:uncharacterized protein LOC105443636 [Strongylocentrotus purpuratus]
MNHWMKKMDEHSNSCVAENSREPDMVLDDHPLEGELPTQDQAPLDNKNLGDPPPSRPDMNAEETAGATPEGTGPGVQALDQMAPKTIEDITGDPSLQDVSYVEEEDPSPPLSLSSRIDGVTYLHPAGDAGADSSTQEFSAIGMEWEKIQDGEGEEILSRPKSLSSKEDEVRSFDAALRDDSIEEKGKISLPLSLSSLNDKVKYRPPANNAGGDSGTQEFYAMVMEWEKMKYEEGEGILSRPKSLSSNQGAPDELSQVRKRSISNALKIHQIKKTNVKQFIRVNNDRREYYEVFEAIKMDISKLQTEVVSLKIDSYNVRKENYEIKRECSVLKSENVQLKIEMSKLKQAHHNDPIDREALRNDTTSFQKEDMSPKAALYASVFQDDDMAQLVTQEE